MTRIATLADLAALLALAGSAMTAAPALAAPSRPAENANVTVARSGVQLATVTDSDGQISCGADCSRKLRGRLRGRGHPRGLHLGAGRHRAPTQPRRRGSRVLWSYDCEEGVNNTNNCTVSQSATVDAHFDDTSVPNLSLTGPADGAIASGTINLSASASDPQTGIANVQFLVDGVAAGSADTSAPYGTSYDTTSHPDDTDVTITARATNTEGDQTTSTVRIKIDNTAPQLTMSGPDGQTLAPVRPRPGPTAPPTRPRARRWCSAASCRRVTRRASAPAPARLRIQSPTSPTATTWPSSRRPMGRVTSPSIRGRSRSTPWRRRRRSPAVPPTGRPPRRRARRSRSVPAKPARPSNAVSIRRR